MSVENSSFVHCVGGVEMLYVERMVKSEFNCQMYYSAFQHGYYGLRPDGDGGHNPNVTTRRDQPILVVWFVCMGDRLSELGNVPARVT